MRSPRVKEFFQLENIDTFRFLVPFSLHAVSNINFYFSVGVADVMAKSQQSEVIKFCLMVCLTKLYSCYLYRFQVVARFLHGRLV